MLYEALEKRDWDDAKRGAMARSAPHNLANVCWYIRWPLDVCESDRNEKDKGQCTIGGLPTDICNTVRQVLKGLKVCTFLIGGTLSGESLPPRVSLSAASPGEKTEKKEKKRRIKKYNTSIEFKN